MIVIIRIILKIVCGVLLAVTGWIHAWGIIITSALLARDLLSPNNPWIVLYDLITGEPNKEE